MNKYSNTVLKKGVFKSNSPVEINPKDSKEVCSREDGSRNDFLETVIISQTAGDSKKDIPSKENILTYKEVADKENATAVGTHNCQAASNWLAKDIRRSRVTFADEEDESDSKCKGKTMRGSAGKCKKKCEDNGKGKL